MPEVSSKKLPEYELFFRIWCQLGYELKENGKSKRTFTDLSKIVKKSRPTLEKIAKKHNWEERVQEFDREVAKRLQKESLDAAQKMLDDNLEIVRIGTQLFGNKIKQALKEYEESKDASQIPISTWEFIQLLKCGLLLTGEATERRDDHITIEWVNSLTDE